jgi:formate hydrogenlyase subunit 6/NADH:ubiquinone oxidoreductase subunit I
MFEMLGNVMKNLVSTPATRMYPYAKREPFKDSRGMVDIDMDNCVFCGLCSRKCPSNAINVSRTEKSWEIDPFKCIICGACAEACPKKCIEMDNVYKSPAYFKKKSKHIQEVKPPEEESA